MGIWDPSGRRVSDQWAFPGRVGRAGSNWLEKKNMQVIIGTEVIDRTPGPPRILAVTFL
jgi:hypothetical protein